jgi:hypothetical protein
MRLKDLLPFFYLDSFQHKPLKNESADASKTRMEITKLMYPDYLKEEWKARGILMGAMGLDYRESQQMRLIRKSFICWNKFQEL